MEQKKRSKKTIKKIKEFFKKKIDTIKEFKEKKEQRLIKKHLERLEKGNEQQRIKAIEGLARIGKKDKEVIEALIKSLEDENYWVKGYTSIALTKLGVKDKRILEIAIKRISDSGNWLERISFQALITQGTFGYVLGAAWYREWLEKEGGNYKKAIKLVKKLNGEEKNKLINYIKGPIFLKSRYWDVRKNVVNFIKDAELKDKILIDALAGSLLDKYETIRKSASKI